MKLREIRKRSKSGVFVRSKPPEVTRLVSSVIDNFCYFCGLEENDTRTNVKLTHQPLPRLISKPLCWICGYEKESMQHRGMVVFTTRAAVMPEYVRILLKAKFPHGNYYTKTQKLFTLVAKGVEAEKVPDIYRIEPHTYEFINQSSPPEPGTAIVRASKDGGLVKVLVVCEYCRDRYYEMWSKSIQNPMEVWYTKDLTKK